VTSAKSLGQRAGLAAGYEPVMGIFTNPDVSNRASAYAPIDESGRHQTGTLLTKEL
jgi:hypothetical protein